jgi:hypothetical protein
VIAVTALTSSVITLGSHPVPQDLLPPPKADWQTARNRENRAIVIFTSYCQFALLLLVKNVRIAGFPQNFRKLHCLVVSEPLGHKTEGISKCLESSKRV